MLSPLTRSNILGTLALREAAAAGLVFAKYRKRADMCWRCPVCRDVHDDELDAEECCQGPERSARESECCEADYACPVCDSLQPTAHGAADCCLWKDIGATERRAMADRVDAGLSTWAEELAKEDA